MAGFRAFYAGLTTDTYLEVMHIEQQKKSYTDLTFTDEMNERVAEAAHDSEAYTKVP